MAGLAIAVGVIGFGIALAWLFVPVLVVAARFSRGSTAG